MGLTLVAILTAALLLPGILATWSFYKSGETPEVEVAIPPLSAPQGIALVGAFSIGVHFLYIFALDAASSLPPIFPLPLADPYLLFVPPRGLTSSLAAWTLFSGLFFLSITSLVVGWLTGLIARSVVDPSVFYGPLADVIESAKGDDKFITAYVLSKIEEGTRLVGYQGTVDSLFRDKDGFPSKVVLRDVVPFYLKLSEDSPRRQESNQVIPWFVVSSADWHNIAFRVFQLVDDLPDQIDDIEP
jgi:hypothetical protein